MASPPQTSVGPPPVSTLETLIIDMPIATTVNTEAQEALYAQFERKRAEAAINVPTDDKRVRARLRSLGHPIILFGEDKALRRDRLRSVLFGLQEAGEIEDVPMKDVEKKEPEQETSYHAGERLLEARKDITRYSISRAQKRHEYQTAESKIEPRRQIELRKEIVDHVRSIDLWASQQASERSLVTVRFSPDSKLVTTGSWGGDLKVFEVPSLNQTHRFRGNGEVVSGLSWVPDVTALDNPTGLHLASGDGNGNIFLWTSTSEDPIAELHSEEGPKAHDGRVAHLDFHPSGRYLASASHDTTWRLWDVTTQKELLIQECHSDACHTVSWNADGSLLASGGYDTIGRIFDIRSGKIIMYLDSHIDHMYALEWGPDGHRVLSGSADGYVKVWDVRAVKEVASIGAHSNGVGDIRWFKGTDGPCVADLPTSDEDGFVPKKSGTLFVTGGMDSNIGIWSADDWRAVTMLRAHHRTVTGVDMSNDGRWIASCSMDKTVKVWGREDGEPF